MKLYAGKEREKILAQVEGRRKILETSLQAVVQGYTSALFVWGQPGLGKSHVLTTLLDGLCPGSWKHHTAYSTPKALMLSLAECPNALHLFEDCERLFKTDLSASILRAACGSPGDRDRWVTYETANERLKVNVTGGIVIATNADLARGNGPMQGVASRFRPIKWEMTLDERVAVILDIADRGFRRGKTVLSAKQCREVAESLLQWVESGQDNLALDIRLYCEHALPTYAHCLATGLKNWESVLAAKLTGIATTKDERQHERTERLQDLAVLIDAGQGSAASKVADWRAKTGLGKAIYYRHLKASKRLAKKGG